MGSGVEAIRCLVQGPPPCLLPPSCFSHPPPTPGVCAAPPGAQGSSVAGVRGSDTRASARGHLGASGEALSEWGGEGDAAFVD